jgi:rhodanese-related sulfurtransferase
VQDGKVTFVPTVTVNTQTYANGQVVNVPTKQPVGLKLGQGDKLVDAFIDVNGSLSFQTGHIPGAIDFASTKAELAGKLPSDKNALIVAYCGNERCSAYAAGAKAAQALGYTNVKHYAKGIQGWKASGENTEK